MTASILTSASEITHNLRETLAEAVRRNGAEAILLSGGLDTSILASLASRVASPQAYTVALEGVPSPDIAFAKLMARHLGLQHIVHTFDVEKVVEELPEVIRTLRVFDPMEIRNSVAVYIGMKQAKEDGVSAFLTGDACDELFAGYSFLFNLAPLELKLTLQRLWEVMSFSAIPLAKSLGMTARIPCLDPEVGRLAERVDPSLLVVEQYGRKWGKWIVRKAFEKQLPNEITWRIKTPIEYGCGTTMLPKIFETKISDNEFRDKQRRFKELDGVGIRDKEQLVYYEIFREAVDLEREVPGRTCNECKHAVPDKATFCRTCGAFPI